MHRQFGAQHHGGINLNALEKNKFGLILIILLALKYRSESIPIAVAAYITSAYWFTSSTSFANPAVTFARALTDTFAGISPRSVPLFVCGQLLGGTAATLLARWLLREGLTTKADSN